MNDTISLIEKVFNITGPWLVIVALLLYVVNQVIGLYVSWNFNKRGVVFAKLHEERAIVIKEMFQKLTILYQALSDFTRSGHINVGEGKTYEQHLQELAKIYNESYCVAKNYFGLNRIFLSYNLCDKIEILLSRINGSAWDYSSSDKDLRDSIEERNILDINEKREYCQSIRDRVNTDILGLLDEMELEFRNLIHGKCEGRKRKVHLWLKAVKQKICNLRLVIKIKSILKTWVTFS
jgi:hypothetical protein